MTLQEQIQKRVLVTGAHASLGLSLVRRLLQGGIAVFGGFKVLAVHPGYMRTNMGGQEAFMSPDESADCIFRLATRAWQTDAPIYMDYLGNPLPW